MSGRSGVDDVQTQEEERAIVSKLATLLPSLGLPACIPWLPIKRKFRKDDIYERKNDDGASLAEVIMDALLGTINATREAQGRSVDKMLSGHNSLKRPLAQLVDRCGEDEPEAFASLAAALGVEVQTVRSTRRNSNPVAEKENSSASQTKKRRRPVEPESPGTPTRRKPLGDTSPPRMLTRGEGFTSSGVK